MSWVLQRFAIFVVGVPLFCLGEYVWVSGNAKETSEQQVEVGKSSTSTSEEREV